MPRDVQREWIAGSHTHFWELTNTHKTTHKGHTHKAYKQSQAYRLDRHAIQALDSYLFLLFPQHGANQANRANGASSLARVFS